MLDLREIRSVTEFQRNAKMYLSHLKKTKKPLVLTVNGRAQVVVQNAASYQTMLDRLERAETVAAIRTGISEIREGKGVPLHQAEAQLRKKHGFPG
ncbi:MAG: type II toxin-antitoxin system Phd/YefM family antitoxin [Acidobacteriota bacterium]